MTADIRDPARNKFQSSGVPKHSPTRIAPGNLMVPFDANLSESIANRYEAVLAGLSSVGLEPYYASDNFILFNDDALPILEKIAKSNVPIDLTVTSPPYNIGKEYESMMSVSDYIAWCASWMELIFKATKSDGAFWLNLGYFEVPDAGLCVPIPYLLWDKSPFYLLQEIVWTYGAGVSSKKRLSPRNEKWLFYVKDKMAYTFNLDDIRDPNVKYPHQKKNGKYRCNPLGKNPSDVWEFPKVTTGVNRSAKERTEHPAQFPLSVVERIIRASSNTTGVVFDPFSGSCSTGIASVGLGRIFVGAEINTRYCDLAIARFKDFKKARSEYISQHKLLFLE